MSKILAFKEIEKDAASIASKFTTVLDTCNPDSPLGKMYSEQERMESIFFLLNEIATDSQNLLAQVLKEFKPK